MEAEDWDSLSTNFSFIEARKSSTAGFLFFFYITFLNAIMHMWGKVSCTQQQQLMTTYICEGVAMIGFHRTVVSCTTKDSQETLWDDCECSKPR